MTEPAIVLLTPIPIGFYVVGVHLSQRLPRSGELLYEGRPAWLYVAHSAVSVTAGLFLSYEVGNLISAVVPFGGNSPTEQPSIWELPVRAFLLVGMGMAFSLGAGLITHNTAMTEFVSGAIFIVSL